MRTFIVLMPVGDFIGEQRRACELIEGTKFNIGGSSQATAIDVLNKVIQKLGLSESHNVEVESITDFMDRFNDEELDVDNYFMSYVYA